MEADAERREVVEQPRRGEERGELGLQPRGMSAHHIVAVDAIRGVLHAVVDFPPEHR